MIKILFFFYIRVLQPNIRHDTQLVDLIEIERLNIDNNNNKILTTVTIASTNEDEKEFCRIYRRTSKRNRSCPSSFLLIYHIPPAGCLMTYINNISSIYL
jgi:hypothetical protein